MLRRLTVLGFSMLGGVGIAHADIYASALTYMGNPSGLPITCRVFNAGLASVNIASRELYDNTGASVAPTSDSCGATLAPKKSCQYGAVSGGNFAFACRINAVGQDVNIRGVTEIISSTRTISLPMTKE
jgi:hypothetical protein